MNEHWATWNLSLLGAIAVLMLIGAWVGVRVLCRLGRIQRLLEESRSDASRAAELPDESSVQDDSAFGRFLEQNPECKELSKSEQFAAYRKWRKQQGLNWVSR